jgi:hypothetical protein
LAVVLPDLAIRAFVMPEAEKPTPSEILTRIAPRLSYPPQEALVDTFHGPSGWVLAAAVRGAVLHQYEQALEALGCHAAWVDGASLIRIPGWSREELENASGQDQGALRIHAQLYPGHYTVTVFRQIHLLDVRTRLRAATDHENVAADLVRLPAVYEGDECQEITLRGEGAAALAGELEGSGLARSIRLGEDGEEAHLRSLVGILMRRL